MSWLRERMAEPSTLVALGVVSQLAKTFKPEYGDVADALTALLVALGAVKKG